MKYAANIALIPEREMYNRAIELSKRLDSEYVLGENAVPHISLVHCVLDSDDFDAVFSKIETLASNTRPLKLRFEETFVGPNSGSFWLKTNVSKEIYELHEDLISQLSPYFCNNPDKSMFANPESITGETEWVKNYLAKSSHENFKPHLTLGFGNLSVALPLEFLADKLSVYQIGRYGSCAKELKTFRLNP